MSFDPLWRLARAASKRSGCTEKEERDWLIVAKEIPIPLDVRVRDGKPIGKKGALASRKLVKHEPWKAIGMTRSTYYRKVKLGLKP